MHFFYSKHPKIAKNTIEFSYTFSEIIIAHLCNMCYLIAFQQFM